jgi:hypothetical protein
MTVNDRFLTAIFALLVAGFIFATIAGPLFSIVESFGTFADVMDSAQ